MDPGTVSFMIPSYNRKRLLRLTVESVRSEQATIPPASEVIVVDGGSSDGTLAWLSRQKDILTIIQHNRGRWRSKPVVSQPAGYYLNLPCRIAKGKYICVLSDDCLIVPGSVARAVRQFNELLAAGKRIGQMGFYWRDWPEVRKYRVYTTLGGMPMAHYALYLREAVADVGYFDEENYRFYCVDGDLSLRMWHKGWEVRYAEESYVEHFQHSNLRVRRANGDRFANDYEAYKRRWHGIYYHPEGGDRGSYREKEFVDPANTARRFGRHRYLRWLATKRLLQSIRQVVAWVRTRVSKGA